MGEACTTNFDALFDGKLLVVANKTKKGGEEKVTGVVPAGGKAVVCVKSADANATGEAAYDVKIQDEAP